MKVLVLGNSDTAGAFHGGRLWTDIVRDGLAEHRGLTAFEEMNLLVVSPRAPSAVEARVRHFQPDLVIMPIGSFVWSVTFVSMRVRKLMGRRVGGIYRRAESAFDARTRRKGTARDRANRVTRAVARRLIGAAPFATVEQTTQAIRNTLAVLARIEKTQVAVIGYPPESPEFLLGKLGRLREQFVADIERAARQHHFLWISGDRALEESGTTRPIRSPDGFHFNALGHQIHGDYVLRKLLDSVETSAPP